MLEIRAAKLSAMVRFMVVSSGGKVGDTKSLSRTQGYVKEEELGIIRVVSKLNTRTIAG